MSSNAFESLSKMLCKSSQNTSKIYFEGGLEAAWEVPLCRGDPKSSFLVILAPLRDAIWGPVSAHFGHCFLSVFVSIFGPFLKGLTLSSIWYLQVETRFHRFGKSHVFVSLLDLALAPFGSRRRPNGSPRRPKAPLRKHLEKKTQKNTKKQPVLAWGTGSAF